MAWPARSTLRERRSSDRSPATRRVGSVVGAGAAEQRLHARQQLGEREGLGEVIVAAGLKALHAIVDRVPRAQDQHRRLDLLRAQLFDQRQAVEAGQHHVDDRRVVAAARRQPQSLGAGRRHIHRIARLAQPLGDEVGDHLIIFRHEHAHTAIR